MELTAEDMRALARAEKLLRQAGVTEVRFYNRDREAVLPQPTAVRFCTKRYGAEWDCSLVAALRDLPVGKV